MISVVMPSYNRAKTIERAVQSILNQTYKDIEIIIVDDNSIDNTEEVVKTINNEQITYIRNKSNKGANESRNIGIRAAKGELIAFQDSDDEWLSNKLEVQLKALKETNADLVTCGFYRYENDECVKFPKEKIKDEEIANKLLYGNFISTQTVIGKRECFVEENFDSKFPRMQDWELMIRMSRKFKIHFVNEPLVNVYLQDNSISKDNTKASSALKMLLEKYSSFYDENPKAKARLLYDIGYYNVLSGNYDKNYYLESFKYNKLNYKAAIKATVFEIKKRL